VSFKRCDIWVCAFCLIFVAMAHLKGGRFPARAQARVDQPETPEIKSITAEELNAKVARNDPVIIIDVRATDAYIGSNSMIMGAIHVKPRRLQSRLAYPPLKDLSREREVVTYCACPNEEASIRAARILSAAGFKRTRALKGGWQAWLKVNGQVKPTPTGT
jgi:rhodanese-related sulfurtransferase